ncbi:hypothetical protein KKB18_03945 [bacterium]|nr:hypothetical protein [bacterium]
MDIKLFSQKVMEGNDTLKLKPMIDRIKQIGIEDQIVVKFYHTRNRNQNPLTPDGLYDFYHSIFADSSSFKKGSQAHNLEYYEFRLKEDGFLYRIDNNKEDTSWRIEITPKK